MGLSIGASGAFLGAPQPLNVATTGLSRTLQMLASGKRINHAADDAAGLAVVTGMLSQLMGMTQAAANAQDAVSMVQTADGALGSTTDVLQRMRELAVQSANGTYSQSDREAIQAEFAQLQDELDGIGANTQFNGRNLLDGSSAASAPAVAAQATVQANARVGDPTQPVPALGDWISGVAITAGAGTTTGSALQLQVVAGQAGGSSVDVVVSGSDGSSQRLTNAAALANTTQSFAIGGATVAVSFGSVAATALNIGAVAVVQTSSTQAARPVDSSLGFQVGANPGQGLQTGFGDARTGALNVEGLSLLGTTASESQLKAQASIAAIDQALQAVGTQRAHLGAVQNRLGYTTDNLNTAVDSLSGAQSRILDTDMAQASTDLARWQILAQVGTAMLGQANLTAAGVLGLVTSK